MKDESEVRRWLKQHIAAKGRRVWWFENKVGGSMGFPDALVCIHARAVFLELKHVSLGGRGREVVEAAPGQLRRLEELRAEGLDAWILCGSEDGMIKVTLPLLMKRVGESKSIGGRKAYCITRWLCSCRKSDFSLERIPGPGALNWD